MRYIAVVILQITVHLDDFHTIQKRPWDIGSIVGGSNKQYL